MVAEYVAAGPIGDRCVAIRTERTASGLITGLLDGRVLVAVTLGNGMPPTPGVSSHNDNVTDLLASQMPLFCRAVSPLTGEDDG